MPSEIEALLGMGIGPSASAVEMQALADSLRGQRRAGDFLSLSQIKPINQLGTRQSQAALDAAKTTGALRETMQRRQQEQDQFDTGIEVADRRRGEDRSQELSDFERDRTITEQDREDERAYEEKIANRNTNDAKELARLNNIAKEQRNRETVRARIEAARLRAQAIGKNKRLPASVAKDLAEGNSHLSSLQNIAKNLDANPGTQNVKRDIFPEAARKLGANFIANTLESGLLTPEQEATKSKMRDLYQRIRHSRFGAALTRYEGGEANKLDPSTASNDAQAKIRIDALIDLITRERNELGYLYDLPSVEDSVGEFVSGDGSLDSPFEELTEDEFEDLEDGMYYTMPGDSQVYQK